LALKLLELHLLHVVSSVTLSQAESSRVGELVGVAGLVRFVLSWLLNL
jgi:hypothetical protein